MSLKQLQDQYNDLSAKVDGIRTINQLPTKIAPDGTEYTPISEPDGSGGFIESKMPVGALHGAKWKEISDDYTLTLADRNSNLAVIVTAKTITLPNDLGWQNGDKCYIYQRVLNLTLDHSAVTTEIPQTLEDVRYCIYQITKEGRESDTDIYNITQVGVATSGGGGGAVDSVNGETGVVVLDADDIDDSATTHKFTTDARNTKVDHLTVTQAVDLDDVESKANTATQPADIADFETTTELNARDTANRDRSNHTGTQTASTISDFDTEVANNSAVTANTAKVGVTTEEENTINSVTTGEPSGSDVVANVVSLTQAEYDAGSPNATTFYIITDA